ncbi:MAG: imidazolonepropionase, partial [Candidatus Aegiribacteria sp.]|nr:imidazolonepropionase [Candidatus Aegiribacteria sp.]MBD3295537.1 imidazolonepropionase [Candidatus Fermentibacteria bacterium]
MKIKADLLITDIGQLVTMAGPLPPRTAGVAEELSIIKDAAIASYGGKIVWTGLSGDTADIQLSEDSVEIDAAGRLVTPGFVDSHTHPIYAGKRQTEFAMRAEGADYEEIAAAGGGILNSVRRTRNASRKELENTLVDHLTTMLLLGTTTVEAKSGYGLDAETEIRCLEILTEVSEYWPQTLLRTFLGAHETPEEYRGRSDEYLDYLISSVLPEIRKRELADFVDIFCEKGVFTPQQSRRYLRKASEMGFELTMHADEFHDTGGAAVAVETGALSADHLLSISSENMNRIAESGTVATLLPGTALFLGKPFPPGRKLIDSGAAVAVATDLNPGSCYCESMPLMVNLAVTQCGLTVEEAITAATVNGAAALGIGDVKGGLAEGMDADMILWDLDDYRGIAYH